MELKKSLSNLLKRYLIFVLTNFLEHAVWTKFVHSPYWFRSVSTFFTEIFPHLINQVGGAHQHTHLLEMSFSVHTINYAPYYLCTFDKIKTGRNVRSVDTKLPWKNSLNKCLILVFPANKCLSMVKGVINLWRRDIGICRHMNLVQTHKYSFLIMGPHIFKRKLC